MSFLSKSDTFKSNPKGHQIFGLLFLKKTNVNKNFEKWRNMVTLATSRSLWDFKFWISSSVSICFWMQIFGRKFESKFLAARWRCCLWSPFLKTVSWDQTFPEPKSSFSLKQNKSKKAKERRVKIVNGGKQKQRERERLKSYRKIDKTKQRLGFILGDQCPILWRLYDRKLQPYSRTE